MYETVAAKKARLKTEANKARKRLERDRLKKEDRARCEILPPPKIKNIERIRAAAREIEDES